jgi:nucleoside-diphosphate-sugar epimerase
MKVLVTGSSGYIGGRLARALAERGYAVTGMDRRSAGAACLDAFVHADLRETPPLADALADADAVFHLAAARADFGIPDREYRRDNVEATRALIELGRKAGVRQWVFYSSVSAMGPGAASRNESASPSPANPYGATKAEAEALFRRLADEDPSVAILVMRPSVVYGPGNSADTNVYRLIRAIDRRRFLMVGDGQTPKALSYVENLLAATLFAWERIQPGLQTYIYVDAPVLTTGEIVERICLLLGRHIPRWRVPLGLATALASSLDVLGTATGIDFPVTAARIRKFCTPTNFDAEAIRELGFRAPVSNTAALEATIRWYRSLAARP